MPTWWRGAGQIRGLMREDTVSRVVIQVRGGEAVDKVKNIRNAYFVPRAFRP
jgi:hypothetical protein